MQKKIKAAYNIKVKITKQQLFYVYDIKITQNKNKTVHYNKKVYIKEKNKSF